MRDMVSLTPLAEYVDLLYTRVKLYMEARSGVTPPKQPIVQSWWLELKPPRTEEEGSGLILLRALTSKRTIAYRANMHAVQHGQVVRLEELEVVISFHIRKFEEEIEAGA